MSKTDVRTTSDVTVDVVGSGSTIDTLPAAEESAIAVLFETMLHFAGLSGRFSVRIEDHIRGSIERRNTVKFQLTPLGGIDYLKVTWQTYGLDTSRKGILSCNDITPRELAVKLGNRYPSLVFDSARDSKVDDTSPGAIFADRKKFRRLAKSVCQHAEQDPETFITRDALVAIIKPIFPRVSFGPGNRVTLMFEHQGYLSAFDDSKEAGGQRRFYVESSLFDTCGLIHPDKRPKPEVKSAPPKPKEPTVPVLRSVDTRLPVTTPPTAVSAPGSGSLSGFLAEVRQLKQKAAEAAELQASIDRMEAEQTEMRQRIAGAKAKLEEQQRAYSKEKGIADAALAAKQVWIDKKRAQLQELGDAKQALADLAELKTLLP